MSKSDHTRLAQCPTKIPPRCARPPLLKGAISVPPFAKGGLGGISQQVQQCTNLMWFDLAQDRLRRRNNLSEVEKQGQRLLRCIRNDTVASLGQIVIVWVLRRGDLCDRPSVIRDFQGEDELRPYQQKDISE